MFSQVSVCPQEGVSASWSEGSLPLGPWGMCTSPEHTTAPWTHPLNTHTHNTQQHPGHAPPGHPQETYPPGHPLNTYTTHTYAHTPWTHTLDIPSLHTHTPWTPTSWTHTHTHRHPLGHTPPTPYLFQQADSMYPTGMLSHFLVKI